jgi:hypothetical protein
MLAILPLLWHLLIPREAYLNQARYRLKLRGCYHFHILVKCLAYTYNTSTSN